MAAAASPRLVSTECPRRTTGARLRYDIDAREGFAEATEGYFVEEHYDAVIESSLPYIDVSKIVMGFEPGPQAYTGKWGGEEHDRATIALLRPVIGGVMFWAVNDVKVSPQNGRTVGQNSNALAAYAAGL